MIKAVIMASGEGTNAENIVSSFKNQEDRQNFGDSRPSWSRVLAPPRGSLAMIENSKKRSTHEEKILSQIRGGSRLIL